MNGSLRTLPLAALFVASASAQDDTHDKLPLRVATMRPDGAIVVDRGTRDFVLPGDLVEFQPRSGAAVQGTVRSADERTAVVEVLDRSAVLPIGTRGFVAVPRSRRTTKPIEVPLPPKPLPPPPKSEDDWEPGMPLLGTTRPPKPEERPRTITGRVYAAANVVRTLDSWSHSFLNTGLAFEVENPNGDGGIVKFHGDFNWSTEAASERSGTDIRLYEFSYEDGGTRFEPMHWQVGRFLVRDMPEFGLLDGVAVGYRRESGSRLGASFGYLPELDEDLETLSDLQVAAWYVWNADIGERVTWGLGYQKSWHRFDQDRDLVVLKARYLPVEGWLTSAAVWVDIYGNRDDRKERDVGLTRANAFAARRWKDAGGIEFGYDHEEYPDILRRELPQTLQPITLAEAHVDRLTMHAFVFAGPTRWFTRLTGWIDEEREGGGVELGVEWNEKDSRWALAGFDAHGLTNNLVGVRLEKGGTYGWGRLDVLYELGFVHHQSFPDDRDDLLQHRLGALATTDLGKGWDGIFNADATLWDDEASFGVGIYLQRHF